MTIRVVTGGVLSGGVTVRCYDEDGTELWTYSHGSTVRAVTMDSDGNVYLGGFRTSNITTRKLDADGNLIWSRDHGADVYCIAVDGDGNVYTGGTRTGSVTTRKYASDGTLIWSKNAIDSVLAVTADSSNNVYTAGAKTSSGVTTRKLDSDGNPVWSYWDTLTASSVLGIAVDSSGNVYTGFPSSSGRTMRKRNSAGTSVWGKNHSATQYDTATDTDGNVYIVGNSASVDGTGTTRKYNTSGTHQWTANHGGTVYSVFAETVLLALVSQPPGLPIPLALAAPTPSFFLIAPGLPLPLALTAPTVTDPPIPPFGDGQAVYHAYLTGMASLVELPLATLQCQKRKNDSTWLTIESPIAPSVKSTVLAAVAAGGQLVVYAGLRTSDGAETLGEFLRATLTNSSFTQTPSGYGVRLVARVAAQLETLQTRVVTGVSGRRSDTGRRSIRCDVHPVLRPGDTVDTGAETWTAHNVRYFIGANTAYMEIEEPPVG